MLCIKIGTMKTIWQLILIGSATIFFQCSSSNTASIQVAESEEKHELIVIDSGFNSWLATQPSIEMYSHAYLKTKNVTFVAEYNSRVNNRQYYGNDLYPQRIEYSSTEVYDKELDYTLYNYFMYFQEKYNQRL